MSPNIGIDAISFYTSKYYLELRELSLARGYQADKISRDSGQNRIAILPPNEDIITMAANSVNQLPLDAVRDRIGLVLFATESSYDLSRAAALTIHSLFKLPKCCRAVELKQACYGATFGLQTAIAWLQQPHNRHKVALLIASDVAHYPLYGAAEATQGCGAVAMLISANPRLLAIDPLSGYCTEDRRDFCRPNYLEFPLFDGRLSCDAYMRLAEETCRQYLSVSGRSFSDHSFFCYHTPVNKLVTHTHHRLAKLYGGPRDKLLLNAQVEQGLIYNREIGNCYTASLYLGLLSLLENCPSNLAGQLVGLYSYGSGATAEFFAGQVVPGYRDHLTTPMTGAALLNRHPMSPSQYESLHGYHLPYDLAEYPVPQEWETGSYYLEAIHDNQRCYAKK